MPGIVGVVLLYFPDSEVHNRISTYLHQLDRLYVIDNSERGEQLSFEHEKVQYHHDGVNQGIATRLNQAAKWAIREGYDWLLTMDQDSAFTTSNIINKYLDCIRNYPGKGNVGMFGVQFSDHSTSEKECMPEETLQLITSGSMVNLELFTSVGPFDESLFIDQVDFDYSFRVHLSGYKTIRFQNIYLEHSLGKETEHISFKNFKKTKRSLHSPIRIYYMTRNYLYMRSKYAGIFPNEIRHMKKDLLYRLKNNLLYNPDRFRVMSSFASGITDFYRKKMGKRR